MHRSLRTLLTEIVDYTALFPPAGLPLAEAVGNFVRHRGEPEAWMLSRFVCPVDKLNQLGNLCEQGDGPGEHCQLSVIGGEHPLAPEFIKDVRAIDQFTKTHGARAAIRALELRLPDEAVREWSADEVSEGLNVLAGKLVEHNFSDIEVFVEPTSVEDWNETVQRIVAALRRHDQEHGAPAPARIGFKLRTGGVETSAFPSVEQVAFAIATCRDANIPLKFTSGLLHPVRHFDQTLKVDMHGFLNVLAGGVFAQARGVDEAVIRTVLEERAARAFTFSDDGFRWHDLEATIDEIETARRELVVSFGSYSLDEPRAGLKALDLL